MYSYKHKTVRFQLATLTSFVARVLRILLTWWTYGIAGVALSSLEVVDWLQLLPALTLGRICCTFCYSATWWM